MKKGKNKNVINNDFRLDFPFFKNNPHLVYLDSAATTLKPKIVIAAINEYYEKYCISNHSQDYPLAVQGNTIFEATRKIVSEFIACQDNEVIFCPSATFAYNQIAFGLEKYLQPGDEILLTTVEHSSLLLPFYRLGTGTKNITIKFIETTENGVITVANLKKALSPKTRVVAFANINNSFAVANDTKTLVSVIKEYGQNNITDKKWQFDNILIVIDGAQAIGHIKTDVKAWNIDFFAFSAHKVFGPTGLGILWGKTALLNMLEPLVLGGGMNGRIYKDNNFTLLETPARFEGGTQNIAAVFGLGVALNYLLRIGLKKMRKHELGLKKYAVKQLKQHLAANVIVYNENDDSSNVIFNIKGIFAQDVANYLGTQNICVRSGTFCAKLLPDNINVDATIRISFYIYNSYADIDALIAVLQKGLEEEGDFLNAFF